MEQQGSGNTWPDDEQKFNYLLEERRYRWKAFMENPEDWLDSIAAQRLDDESPYFSGWKKLEESSSYHKQRYESLRPGWLDSIAAQHLDDESPYFSGWKKLEESSSYHKQRYESRRQGALRLDDESPYFSGWKKLEESSSYHKQRYESPRQAWLDSTGALRLDDESPYFSGWKKLEESSSYHKQRYESPRQGMTPILECITCKRQFVSQAFCACHRRLTPIIDEFQLKSSPAKARPGSSSLLPDPTRSTLSGGGTSTMHNHGSIGEVVGFAHEHGNIEMEGMHSSDDVQGGPTLELRGDSSSHGFADEDSDIERGRTHSSDGVPSEPRLVDPSSAHLAQEDTWHRLATMVDPLLGVNVQGAFSLVAYKSSDGSSPAKDVLLYLLVFVYVLGFLSAIGGKLYPRSKMGVIGLGAAALGFLMTMALVVVHKIG